MESNYQSLLSPYAILGIIAVYFVVLIVISHFTSKNSDNSKFFLAGRNAPWILVAIGMIGASLSGVTFISVPGKVGAGGANKAFSYLQFVMGNLVGYFVIAKVLLPLYYRHNLTSIYGYLEKRLGFAAYKTGATFFLISRGIGSALRLYLAAIVLHNFCTAPLGLPFVVTVFLTIGLIYLYTAKGGVNTILYTDVLLTTCMLSALVMCIYMISQSMGSGFSEMIHSVSNSKYSKIFFFSDGWADPNNFFKQFLSGALISIVMTGLDQDLMQKNLTCRTLKDAQKNVFTFCINFFIVNIVFLTLGAALYLYAAQQNIPIPTRSDEFFPMMAMQYLGITVCVLFFVGLIASTYASADSALTALTTSICVDFLDIEKKENSEKTNRKIRTLVHLGISFVLFLLIMVFYYINSTAVVDLVFKIAGLTYGPLLGLFSFGIFTRFVPQNKWVPIICILCPLFTWWLDSNSEWLLGGFKFGFLTLALNGLLIFIGLRIVSKEKIAQSI
ncbi:MAG: sodium:solute symporter [Saprospiraceae bacterium]|uniref:sodium:solute symporter n=1 Tax=Candidatus Brachybacter algidus TaxID=2982024 RepID=UPI00257F5741|nr:sodium:solute symporter [Candidatus Brachybacter algidus]MBK7602485.1 sodium:solute symporter [Candidatus Brachybacter algidus]